MIESKDNLPRPKLRCREAAEYLGVSFRSLLDRSWRERHGVPCFRIGKAVVFDPDTLDAWLAANLEQPKTAGHGSKHESTR